ncbi:hypothetical protein CALVIDRAFT_479910 [Calocera viscosa TUFC12733]|uniref:CxC5 like cysteine cluster associated with KDZ domain-containing protein n=1 Tax=Calocera viscosa (strain TUFC12733) TaxID=1330018 RepID=A0A167NGB8_CALVF|nr:hypothetical protein CALVIDRAFT_479910 [Calocera viscosa TUFC12733]
MLVFELLQRLSANILLLGNVPAHTLWDFSALVSHFQPILAWTGGLELDRPSLFLPHTVVSLLAHALALQEGGIHALWNVLGPVIWQQHRFGHEPTSPLVNPLPQIVQHGPLHALGTEEFFPPTRTCTQVSCPSGMRLVDARRHHAYYFTLDKGVLSVYVSSLRCKTCGSTYYLNYCRQVDPDGVQRRHYYPGRPRILHVETHILIDSAVATLFKTQALHAHASGQATARIYNSALSGHSPTSSELPHHPLLRIEYVWDTFYLDALLQHHCEQGTILILSEHLTRDGGGQRDRLREALHQRNIFIAGTGQEYYPHACDGCVRVREDNVMIHAAITDGVTIGHPCCGVHNCQEALPSLQARFCNTHTILNGICAIRECHRPVDPPSLTCDLPEHLQVQQQYEVKGQSMFNLARRLANLSCNGKSASGNRTMKAKFGRSWTHNEQLIVRPCGIIVARATFYGAEAISSVADMLRAVFPTANSVPDILFYDNNCHLRRHLLASGSSHFASMGQPVDVFHFKAKHSEQDAYCGQHCNPLLFPDIYDADTKKWFFNSSAAEQANVWINGYHSIVHDMEVTAFNFFLDEMIKERNRFLVHTLERQGKHPHFLPREWLLSDTPALFSV